MSSTPAHSARQDALERLAGIGSFEWTTGSGKVSWSDQMFRLFGYKPGEVEPGIELILSRVHPDDRAALRRLIEVQEDEGHPRRHIFRIVRPEGEIRFLLGVVGEVLVRRGSETGLLGTVQDITESELTSRALEADRRISVIFGTWEIRPDPIADLLTDVSDALAREVAALWVPDEGEGVLECIGFWSEPSLDVSELESASRRFRFPGQAAIGRAWRAGAPAHISDIGSADAFLRRDPAIRSGLHSWASFPALHRDKVVAIVELFSGERSRLNDADTLSSVGRVLGEFLAWKGAELRPTVQLTERELEVLQDAADGVHVAKSAERLEVRPATVKSHFRNIFEKLGVSDRAAAVAEGMRRGLVH